MGKCVAALFAVCMVCGADHLTAQTQIQIEESTGTTRAAQPGSPIEISIPATRAPSVQLTTSTGERAAPQNETDSIDLTPAEFRARRQENLPVTAPQDAQTTSPSTAAPQQTPPPQPQSAPMQVMPDEQDSTDTLKSIAPKPVEEPPVPVQDTQTVIEQPASEQAEPDVEQAGDESVDYMPPADLGTQETLARGEATVPMLPSALTPPSLEVTVPDVFQTTLTNGMKFYHYESRDLPRVRISAIIDAGTNADPADKVGLAALAANTIRSGGAGERSADQVDEALDQIGAEIEIAAENDHVRVSVFTLTEQADAATKILADMLMRPRLDEAKFEQERGQLLEMWRRRNDDPREVSRREFRRVIYGKDYPLARVFTSGTLNAISLDDVRQMHQQHYRPDSVWIGVSGDMTSDEARSLVDSAFAGWDRPAGERVPVPPAIEEPATSSGVYLTRRATAQSQVRMGHLGLERRSPKAYAVNVLNSVYGQGGFSSRLMNVVRTKHGFAYGAGGGIYSDDPVGLFAGIAATQPSTTIAAIQAMLDVTRDIVESGITDEELETARRDVIFTFISAFQTPENIVTTHMQYDFRGYPDDYLKTFPERVRNVTKEDVNAVAREMMEPENLIIYVIGNPDEMNGNLDQFGPVTEWPLDE